MSIVNYNLSPTNVCFYDKMSPGMDMDFPEWLLDQLSKRGWSQSDLAKHAYINRQLVETYVNRKRKKYDPEMLAKIAKALNEPTEVVFRAAGLLNSVPANTEQKEQMVYLFDQLSENDRQTILDMMNFLLSK